MTRFALAVASVTASIACGAPHPEPATPAHPQTTSERMLGLLPDGAQVVVELDLARLRANPVVGDVVRRALALGADLPATIQLPSSPLVAADAVMLAAYGVGTSQAAMITLLATAEDVPNARRVAPGFVALGPTEWLDQVEARGKHAGAAAPAMLLALRDHAMPPGATGATLRVTARLPFDARVALARQTGFDITPAQLSIWGDVADDLAIIVDADAADPGDRTAKTSTRRMAGSVRSLLGRIADEPAIRALGIPSSLGGARVVTQGSWVRAIIAIGPEHLHRVVERALALLHLGPPGPAAPAPAQGSAS